MNKLKELLFKRALMYRNAKTDVLVAHSAFLAISEIITEAGLDEEFQQYKTLHNKEGIIDE